MIKIHSVAEANDTHVLIVEYAPEYFANRAYRMSLSATDETTPRTEPAFLWFDANDLSDRKINLFFTGDCVFFDTVEEAIEQAAMSAHNFGEKE